MILIIEQPEKCPKCNSGKLFTTPHSVIYECRTSVYEDGSTNDDSWMCLRNQRDQLHAEVERLKVENERLLNPYNLGLMDAIAIYIASGSAGFFIGSYVERFYGK